jgi:class 3 adenylate cyclase/CheY-like chemotaxis protein
MATSSVLLVQSDSGLLRQLERVFRQLDFDVYKARSLGEAINLMEQFAPPVVAVDLHFPDQVCLRFLDVVRRQFPNTRMIVTTKTPDFNMEMRVREYQVDAVLRAPFTVEWAKGALGMRTQEEDRVLRHAQGNKPLSRSGEGRAIRPPETARRERHLSAKKPKVRLPLRLKITLPFVVLALIISLAAGYVVTRLVVESMAERFESRLKAAGTQTADEMVHEEKRLLETLRLAANANNLSQFIAVRDANALRAQMLPLAVNSEEEIVHVLDMSGQAVLSLYKNPDGPLEDYRATQGDRSLAEQGFVQFVLTGQVDAAGNKTAGLADSPLGRVLYVAGPVYGPDGALTGVVLVGKTLASLTESIKADVLGEVSLYDSNGTPITSTFSDLAVQPVALPQDAVLDVLQNQAGFSLIRDFPISSDTYREILGPWEIRNGEDLGVIGVALGQFYQIQSSLITQIQIFILIAISVLTVILTGVTISNHITRPLLQVVAASEAVSKGNLDVKVNVRSKDEIAVLAHSFNYMVQGLQEGSIYRDLLGRTVSPEVRETLRNTFASGNVNLEGQEAIATVLFSDIREFTTLSEQADPAAVFKWLNEYFAELVPIITENGGVVNKFDGDAILAFFGILPRLISPQESARSACKTAIAMLSAIERINRIRVSRGDPVFITGIGINTGLLIAGGLGSADRMHYTIIGDTVNTTQRIEDLTRNLCQESCIVISRATLNALGPYREEFAIEPMGFHQVKGKAESVLIYSLRSKQ